MISSLDDHRISLNIQFWIFIYKRKKKKKETRERFDCRRVFCRVSIVSFRVMELCTSEWWIDEVLERSFEVSFWWNAKNHHVSSRTPGLRARWLAFNEAVVRASLRLNFADAPLFVSIWVPVCSIAKLIRRVGESERRCAFRLGIKRTIGRNNWFTWSTWIPYVNRWIVRFVFDFGAELLMRLLLGKIFVQKSYWRKSGNVVQVIHFCEIFCS